MLQFQTVLPDTLELLKVLMRLPLLENMRLVGGTSLALQYGHRRSVDLDFFGHTTADVNELTSAFKECVERVIVGGYSKDIKAYFLNDVKVDIVNYDYRWIDDVVQDIFCSNSICDFIKRYFQRNPSFRKTMGINIWRFPKLYLFLQRINPAIED